MRIPNALLCATMIALLIATSVSRAEVPGETRFISHESYLSPVEPLIRRDPISLSEYNRPQAAIGTFAFDFLFLERSNVDDFTLVTVNGASALDASDFNFDETGAFRFTATIPSACGVDLQLSYLGSHEFSTTRTFTGAVVQDQFFGAVAPVTELSMTHEAPLDSFEVNLRARQWERFSPLAGVRLVKLDESSLQVDVTNGLSFLGTSTNQMAGIQFGGEWMLGRLGAWRFESVFKAGVYYNDINVEGDGQTIDFNRKFSTTSFVGELSMMAVYEFTPRATFRIGYQGLWMEGTALLYDQYDNFFYTNGNGSIDLGSVNYQGGYAGFDLTW